MLLQRVRPVAFALAACLVLLAGTARAAVEDFHKLPGDMIWGVTIPNVSEFKSSFSESRFGEAWRSPENESLRNVYKQAYEQVNESLAEETGVELKALLGELNGFVSVFSTHLKSGISGEEMINEFDINLVAHVPAERREAVTAIVREMLSDIPEDAKRSVEDFRGTKIYNVSFTQITTEDDLPSGLDIEEFKEEVAINIQYAFTGDYLVFCEGPNQPAQKVLNAMLSEGADRMEKNDSFVGLEREAGGLDGLFVWLDAGRLMETLFSENAEAKEGLDKLGLMSLGGMVADIGMKDEGLSNIWLLDMPREKKGLIPILYAGSANRLQTAPFVPSNAITYSSFTLDLDAVWRIIRSMTAEDPNANAQLDTYLGMAQMYVGLNIETDIISHIKGEHAYFTLPTPTNAPSGDDQPGFMVEASPWVFLLALTDGQRTVSALDGMFNRMKGDPFQLPLKRSEQDGFGIWGADEEGYLAGGGTPMVGLMPKMLVFGSTMAVTREAMRRTTGNGGGASLASDPAFQRDANWAKSDNLRFFSFNSPQMYEQTVREMQEQLAILKDIEDFDIDLDEEDLPPAEWWLRYFGSSATSVTLSPEYLRLESLWRTAE